MALGKKAGAGGLGGDAGGDATAPKSCMPERPPPHDDETRATTALHSHPSPTRLWPPGRTVRYNAAHGHAHHRLQADERPQVAKVVLPVPRLAPRRPLANQPAIAAAPQRRRPPAADANNLLAQRALPALP